MYLMKTRKIFDENHSELLIYTKYYSNSFSLLESLPTQKILNTITRMKYIYYQLYPNLIT